MYNIPRSSNLVMGRARQRSNQREAVGVFDTNQSDFSVKKTRRRSSSVSALTLDQDAFSAFVDSAIEAQMPKAKGKRMRRRSSASELPTFRREKKEKQPKKTLGVQTSKRKKRDFRRSRSFAAFSNIGQMAPIDENGPSVPASAETPANETPRRMRRRNSSVLAKTGGSDGTSGATHRRRRSSSASRSSARETMYEPGKDSTRVQRPLRRRRSSSSIARKQVHEEVKPTPTVRKTRPRSSSMPSINVPSISTPSIAVTSSSAPKSKDRSRSPSPAGRRRKKPALVRKVSAVFLRKSDQKETNDDDFSISAPFDVNAPTNLAPTIWIDNGNKELKKSKSWSKAISGRKSPEGSPSRGRSKNREDQRIIAQQNQALKLLSPKQGKRATPDPQPTTTDCIPCPRGFTPILWWRPLPPTPPQSRPLPDIGASSQRSSNSSACSTDSVDSMSDEGKAQVAANAGQSTEYQTKQAKKEKRLTFYSMVSNLTGNNKKGGYQATIVGAKARFNDASGRGKRIIMFEIAVYRAGQKWTVFRRYKQFQTLNSRLRKKNLIKKFSFKTEIGPRGHGQKEVEARGNRLNKYLQRCLAIPEVNASQYMHTFIMPFQLGDIKPGKT